MNIAAPVKLGTSVVAVVQTNAWVVAGQRSGSPNRSTQPLAGGGVVGAAGRLDVDLGRQRDREDLAVRRLRDAELEAQRGCCRILDDLDPEHRELGGDACAAGGRQAHSPARASSDAKKSATAPSIARPPEIPSQRDLIIPTSS